MNALVDSPIALVGLMLCAVLIVLLPRRVIFTWGSIHAELRPNGGRSIKDRVDRLDRNMVLIAERLGILDRIELPPEQDGTDDA